MGNALAHDEGLPIITDDPLLEVRIANIGLVCLENLMRDAHISATKEYKNGWLILMVKAMYTSKIDVETRLLLVL